MARVSVLLADSLLPPGESTHASAIAYDANDSILSGLSASWSTSNSEVATVSSFGLVQTKAVGQTEITATIGNKSNGMILQVEAPAGLPTEERLINTMLGRVPAKIQRSLEINRLYIQTASPLVAPSFQNKIDLLQQPGLAEDIVRERRATSRQIASADGRKIPAAAVFPASRMQKDAKRALELLDSYLPILEQFFGAPYPVDSIRVWYGFTISGNSEINIEDEESYNGRPPGLNSRVHEAVLAHELAHSMMGHEALNTFLEIYLTNMARQQSTQLSNWGHMFGYVPGAASNRNVHAVLDIYRLIGFDRMRSAFQRLRPLKPRFGSELSSEMKQVFIDAAPASERASVTALVDRIGI